MKIEFEHPNPYHYNNSAVFLNNKCVGVIETKIHDTKFVIKLNGNYQIFYGSAGACLEKVRSECKKISFMDAIQ